MPISDLDCYYTPPRLAAEIVDSLGERELAGILDSACGRGELLSAAERAYPLADLFGIDQDRAAIRALRRKKPQWTLLVGDALQPNVWKRTISGRVVSSADALVLNPPFSMAATKGTEVIAWGNTTICSVAMAHILNALGRASAKLATAIVPESWAYADRDSVARKLLSSRYQVQILRGLKNSTFRGARANSLVIRLERRPVPKVFRAVRRTMSSPDNKSAIDVVRGGLPVFERQPSTDGLPFIHSTVIELIARKQPIDSLPTVRAISRGIVQGHVVLVPRVGVPRAEQIKAVFLQKPCQLSDCVIALRGAKSVDAKLAHRAIEDHFAAFTRLYKGTGARYITVDRIKRFTARYC